MRKLNKPSFSPKNVYRACISIVKNKDLKQRLEKCEKNIITASNEFEKKVANAQLHTIKTSNNILGIVTTDEMMKVYTSRMVRKNTPGRIYYDLIKSAPAHGRCPLCGQRTISTLDHHLPKSKYPSLVVSPVNLIPSCSECNKIKTDNIPKTGKEESLHPYFDNVEVATWLKCKIQKKTLSVYFYVKPPKNWDTSLSNRVKYHFDSLELNDLFISHASEEISFINLSLKKLYSSSGKKGVREHLADSASSRANVFKNSWQTALYYELSTSDWFCSGGFEDMIKG